MLANQGEFWARKMDLERLFEAKHLCYILGSLDGLEECREIIRLSAVLGELTWLRGRIMPVLLIPLRHLESYREFFREQSRGSGGPCFLYYGLENGDEGCFTFPRELDGLVALTHPPTGRAQILAYGGGFSDEIDGQRKLDLIEALDGWLYLDGEDPCPPPPLFLVGQRMSAGFASGLEGGRFAKLLERASAIAVRDERSFQVVATGADSTIPSKLYLLDDDVALEDWGSQSQPAQIAEGLKPDAELRTAIATPAAEAIGKRTGSDSRTVLLLGQWLISGYVADLERRHQSTGDRLFESMAQLSDLEFEHDRLLNTEAKLNIEIQKLQRQIEVMTSTKRFLIAERINDLMGGSRFVHRLGEIVAQLVWRVIR